MVDQTENKQRKSSEPSPIELVLEFLRNPLNIAVDLEEKVLAKIAQDVQETIEADEETMIDWKETVEWGQDLADRS